MTKRRKKNQITLISLLVAIVLLSGFYVWYLNRDRLSDSSIDEDIIDSDTDSLIVATMDPNLIDKIHFKNENTDMTFILEEDVWVSEVEKLRPIKQNYVKNMVNLMDEVKANRLVSDSPKELATYGLDTPYAFIEATQSDGKSLAINIGNKISGGKGYYANIEGDDAVYILPVVYGANLSYNETNMTLVEHGPNIDPDSMFRLEVNQRDGESLELIYDPDSLYHTAVTPMYSWAILKPYEEVYAADGSKVTELLTNYSSFSFLSCVEYKTEDFAKYGLENPIATVVVEYYEQADDKTSDKSFKLHIGGLDDSSNYYVRKDGDKAVYTMNATAVDAMLNVDSFSVLSSFINIYNISTVNKIDIDIEGKLNTLEIKREIFTNEDGEEEIKSTYYYNDEVTDESLFKDLYQVIISAKYDVQLDKEESVSSLKPILTISYRIEGSSQPYTTSYYPYDDSFYLVDNGYPIRFAADKRKIDKIIKTIEEFKHTKD